MDFTFSTNSSSTSSPSQHISSLAPLLLKNNERKDSDSYIFGSESLTASPPVDQGNPSPSPLEHTYNQSNVIDTTNNKSQFLSVTKLELVYSTYIFPDCTRLSWSSLPEAPACNAPLQLQAAEDLSPHVLCQHRRPIQRRTHLIINRLNKA